MLETPLNVRIAATLRERIVGGQLPFGARISDKALAEELGASRTPVREALLALQGEGFVTMLPQSGTFVFDPGIREIGAICELRGVMEAGALRIAAERDARRLVATLGEIVSEAALACAEGDLAACERLDTHFHETLVARSENEYLIAAYSNISAKIRALRTRLPSVRDRVMRAIEQHRRVLDLVTVGRISDAEAELRGHMKNVHAVLSGWPRLEGDR